MAVYPEDFRPGTGCRLMHSVLVAGALRPCAGRALARTLLVEKTNGQEAPPCTY